MLTLKLLSIAALLGSLAWLWHSLDYEPAIACVTTLSASVATFVADRRAKRKASQAQDVSGGSIGIQAGGDVSVGRAYVSKRQD